MSLRPRLSTILVLLLCAGLLLWRHSGWRRVLDPDEANDAVFEVLEQPLDFSVEGKPLKVALEQFSRQTGVPVEMDSFLQLPSDPRRMSVSLHLPGCSAAAVLNLLLRQVDLDFLPVVKNGRVVITSRERAVNSTAYFVGQVHTIPPAVAGERGLNASRLVDLLQVHLPLTREDPFSTGAIEPLPGAIAVSNLASEQRFIRRLIEALTSVERGTNTTPWVCIAPSSTSATLDLRQKMQQVVSVDFHQMPLRDVIDDLARTYSLPVFIDRLALEQVAIDLDVPVDTEQLPPVTLRLTNVRLETVFRWLFDQTNLTCLPYDDVIYITASDEAEEFRECRVYDVGCLIDRYSVDSDTLIEMFQSIFGPDLWIEYNSSAVMVCSRSLIVTAEPEMQDQLAGLLQRLNTMFDPRAWPADGDAKPVGTPLFEQLTRAVTMQVDRQPLGEWLDTLRMDHGLNIVVYPGRDFLLDLQETVSGAVTDRPMLAALKSLVDPLGLDFTIVDEVLVLVPKELLPYDGSCEVRLYDTAAILSGAAVDWRADRDENRLDHFVADAILPGSWQQTMAAKDRHPPCSMCWWPVRRLKSMLWLEPCWNNLPVCRTGRLM